MPAENTDILTQIRSLLLLFDPVTNIVDDRIRPNGFHSTDENEPALMLELIDGNQINPLDRTAVIVDGVLQITVRSPSATQAAEIAESIRTQGTNPSTGLDGYTGSAGSGFLVSAERVSFSTGKEVDEDGDETSNFISLQVYQILFKMGG
jgi:hypothetical protein